MIRRMPRVAMAWLIVAGAACGAGALTPPAIASGPVVAAPGVAPAGPAAAADSLPLPQPVYDVSALPGIGLRADRLAVSKVPGPTAVHERVDVAVGADGTPATVSVTERITVTGTGDYVIRQRGPARRAEAIGDTVPPVVKLGTVLWQGFSPRRRDLAARLTLDAGLEAPRLPLAVTLSFRDPAGKSRPLSPGAVTPGAGTVVVTLTNQTRAPVPVAAGAAEPAAAGRFLDALRAAATSGAQTDAPPPAPGRGLPTSVPGHATGDSAVEVAAPLRVTGTVTADPPATVDGPGTTPSASGAEVAGTLTDSVAWTVSVRAPTRIGLDLTAVPKLDPRALVPPQGAASWTAWARPAAPADVTSQLLTQAATATRAAEFVGYLSIDAATTATTDYHVSVQPAARTAAAAAVTDPDPVAILAATVALLAILTNAFLLRRVL